VLCPGAICERGGFVVEYFPVRADTTSQTCLCVRRETRHTHKHTLRTTQHTTRQEQYHKRPHDEPTPKTKDVLVWCVQVLFANAVALLWNTYLSHAAHANEAGQGLTTSDEASKAV